MRHTQASNQQSFVEEFTDTSKFRNFLLDFKNGSLTGSVTYPATRGTGGLQRIEDISHTISVTPDRKGADASLHKIANSGIDSASINLYRSHIGASGTVADSVIINLNFSDGGKVSTIKIQAEIVRYPAVTETRIDIININDGQQEIVMNGNNITVKYLRDDDSRVKTEAKVDKIERAACKLTADGARLFIGCAIRTIADQDMASELQSQRGELSVKLEAAVKFADLMVGVNGQQRPR